jgi:hypothetical protein
MTAKERLVQLVEACSETEAEDMLRVLDELELAVGTGSYPSVFPARSGEPITEAELHEHFGHLPTDDEG